VAYGGLRSGEDVFFPYKTALIAAQEVAKAGRVIRSNQEVIDAVARLKTDDWSGTRRTDFDDRLVNLRASVHNVAQGLESLAQAIAVAWSECRGQQDRISHARWGEAAKADDHVVERLWQRYFGETDYGPAPHNPPIPTGPDFSATRPPVHHQYDRSHLKDR
jgi:hypothetical protein